MSVAAGPEGLPGYHPPLRLTEPVGRRARPGWNRWRCDLIDDEPAEGGGATATRGVGHRSVEFRRSPGGDALLAAARAQARLDGHIGVVSIHRAHLAAGGFGEVRLGWAGATLAGVLAQRLQPRRSASAADEALGIERTSTNPIVAGTKLPTPDVAAIGASVSAALAAAHGLCPPLVHGALDATTIRLDRWGRARLDGFGTGGHDRQLRPEDDVVDLLVTINDAIGSRTTALGERDPTETLISRLLAAVSRRRPEVIEALELHRALEALAVGYMPTMTVNPSPTTTPCRPIRALAPRSHTGGGSAPLEHDGDDLTVTLDGEYRVGPAEGLPDHLIPLRCLGRGGHGEVWLARDRVLARNVVVKRFHPDAPGIDAPADDDPAPYPVAMGHELAALTQLAGHPASTECYGAFIDGPPSLVLSWCSEGPLDSKRPWGPAELAHLGAQVADALAILHGRGLVHGDVKPHNLLRDRWGAVRLADFSLTSPTGEVSARECSPRHAPPEQLEGGRLSDGVDLAGLAATLFHLSVGRPPLERGDGTEALVARRLAGETETPPESLRGLPELSDWILAWLDPDPHARPTGGAAAAAAALRSMYQPRHVDLQLAAAPQDPRRSRTGARLATVAVVAITAALGAAGLGASESTSVRHRSGSRPTEPGAAENQSGKNRGFGVEAITVAIALPPADPLSAEPVDLLALERRDQTVVLTRRVHPPSDVAWVVRRDDFSSTGRLVDDQPSASGLVGPDGTITDTGHSIAAPTNGERVLRAGAQRSLVMAQVAGVSCVRVVTADRPPQVSPPLCWE